MYSCEVLFASLPWTSYSYNSDFSHLRANNKNSRICFLASQLHAHITWNFSHLQEDKHAAMKVTNPNFSHTVGYPINAVAAPLVCHSKLKLHYLFSALAPAVMGSLNNSIIQLACFGQFEAWLTCLFCAVRFQRHEAYAKHIDSRTIGNNCTCNCLLFIMWLLIQTMHANINM